MTDMISDDECRRALAAKKKHGSERAAARALGMPKTSLRYRLERAAERGMMGYKPVLPGMSVKQISTQRDASGNTERDWIKTHKAPGPAFAMPDGQIIKGVSALVDADGLVRQKWIKTKSDGVTADLVEVLKSTFANYKGRSKIIKPPRRVERDLLTVYPIADQHNGLLAWGTETGESYDLKIGADRLLDCSARLVARSPRSKYAIILNLGDWQHADDQRNVTPRSGHQLDVDGRWFKVLTVGVKVMMRMIELALAKHERVLVRNIPGNHDPHAARALTVALAAFYANNRRVTIDPDPGEFFYHRFGTTLLGAHHGHTMKPDRMAMDMAVNRREDWGATDYHWFLFGHIHHETAKEVGDVRVESFQTIAAKDANARSGGYNAGKSLNSITLHRRDGEFERARVNVPPPRRVNRSTKPDRLFAA